CVGRAIQQPDRRPAAVQARRCCFFFFQAEDGIRDFHVTGVQTCALPIYPPLREFLAAWVQGRGIEATPDQVLILTGSQQGIDLACKALLDPGDVVLVERPTYLTALQVFRMYQARAVAVPGDDEGIDPDALEKAIAEHRPKMLYAVPTFRNPSGETW